MSKKMKIIDIHAHVLPGVDDGARDWKESVRMLMLAASQGITEVVATPHYSRRHEIHGVKELAEELTRRIQKFYPEFRVHSGQELYYHEELTERLKQGKGQTLAGGRFILIEFNPSVSYRSLFQGVRKLQMAGYKPVLAHIERYGCLRQAGLEDLISGGCFLQMNYDSLCGRFYQSEVRWCRRQVEEGKIHVLASDMHRMDYRPPEIENALGWLERHINPERLEQMLYQNPFEIING